jgi:hypothetical protein
VGSFTYTPQELPVPGMAHMSLVPQKSQVSHVSQVMEVLHLPQKKDMSQVSLPD